MNEVILNSISDMLNFVPRTLFIMFTALTVTWIMIKKGIIGKIAFIGKPLALKVGLPAVAGLTFVTSFGSGLSGNVLLSDFNKRGELTDYHTYLGALFNSIPVYIKESFTYQIPVIIPVLGLKVGLVYFACFLLSGVVKLIFVASCAKSHLSGQDTPPAHNTDLTAPLENSHIPYLKQMKIFFKMSGIFITVTFAVFCLINSGYMRYIEKITGPLTGILKLPGDAAVPVGTYIFSPLAGAASIGAMLQNGKLMETDAMIASLLGSFLMLPVFMIRGSLARYTSIFGASIGFKVVLTSTVIGMGTRLLFLIAILLIRG